MDFNRIVSEVLASIIIVLRRFLHLILTPYKTMRSIALENDRNQIYIIFGLVVIVFYLTSFFRDNSILRLLTFLFQFWFSVFFFYGLGRVYRRDIHLKSFIFTFSYSLLPTLIWFLAILVLYIILPPPRTASVLGASFSIFFLSFSLFIFFWKTMLFYLALRFSTREGFYRVLYLMLLYGVYLVPYTLLSYALGISRVPFV